MLLLVTAYWLLRASRQAFDRLDTPPFQPDITQVRPWLPRCGSPRMAKSPRVCTSSGCRGDVPAVIQALEDRSLIMAYEFRLSDPRWVAIKACPATNRPGARRIDDRRVISGIIHVLKSGCRWRDCPSVYGPYTTVYNRWNRWSRRAVWRRLFEALREVSGNDDSHALDGTTAKAHRAAAGGKGGQRRRLSAARVADARPRSTPSATRSGGSSPSI